jgi:ketosteroid isomerase-like protein
MTVSAENVLNERVALAEITAVRRRFAEVLFNRDHAALPVLFTADTLLLPSGKPLVRGRDNAVAFWTAASSNPDRQLRSEYEALDSLFEGAVVIESGRATVWAVEAGREQLLDRGKYVVVWKREDGRWRRHRDIYNSDAPKT